MGCESSGKLMCMVFLPHLQVFLLFCKLFCPCAFLRYHFIFLKGSIVAVTVKLFIIEQQPSETAEHDIVVCLAWSRIWCKAKGHTWPPDATNTVPCCRTWLILKFWNDIAEAAPSSSTFTGEAVVAGSAASARVMTLW